MTLTVWPMSFKVQSYPKWKTRMHTEWPIGNYNKLKKLQQTAAQNTCSPGEPNHIHKLWYLLQKGLLGKLTKKEQMGQKKVVASKGQKIEKKQSLVQSNETTHPALLCPEGKKRKDDLSEVMEKMPQKVFLFELTLWNEFLPTMTIEMVKIEKNWNWCNSCVRSRKKWIKRVIRGDDVRDFPLWQRLLISCSGR